MIDKEQEGNYDLTVKDDVVGKKRKQILEELVKEEATMPKKQPAQDRQDDQDIMKQHPEWVWDRKCPVCGARTMMVSPEIFNEEVYECQNKGCRKQVKLLVTYDSRGKFVKEEIDRTFA